jgi:DNA-binding CsgD family transcriptional regulator
MNRAYWTLTRRELAVLGLAVNGVTDYASEARQLGISPYTIRYHWQLIRRKLGVQSRIEAVLIGWQAGMQAQEHDGNLV